MATKFIPKTPVQIGPLIGGLNNVSNAGESKDTEVVDLVNFEVTLDQALTSRPPLQLMAGSTLPDTNTLGWEILGIYRTTATEFYLIVVVPTNGSTNVNTTVKAYLNGIVGTGETVTTIKNSTGIANKVTSMVQFNEDLYFNVNAGATDRGFHWKVGEATGGTTVSTMPRGSVMISWKTRLWVSGSGVSADGNRVYFSTIDGTGPHPDTWDSADFFDVEPGQGGFVTAMQPSFNNLIIFKNDGTWRWSFAVSPLAGQVNQISGEVGASGKNAVVPFENYMYVYDQGKLYELVNSNYTQVNRFVQFNEDPLAAENSVDVELSVLNRRVLVKYFNALYSFNVDTKSWSVWRSYAGVPGRFTELPADSASSASSIFVAPSRGTLQILSENLIEDPDFSEPDLNTKRMAVPNAVVSFDSGTCTMSSVTTSGISGLVLNTTGSIPVNGQDPAFQIPVSGKQKFQFKLNVLSVTNTWKARVYWLLGDGTVTSGSSDISTTGVLTFNFTVPDTAILAVPVVAKDAAGDAAISFKDPEFYRTNDQAPLKLIKFVDEYPDQAAFTEFIPCYFQTKSFDYKTPGSFKRLYWGGIDIKTFMETRSECRPVSRVAPVLWGDLEQYTHSQLQNGVWGNPLSWLTVIFAVFNQLDADEVMSENGRYFKKIGESIRFRQISYKIATSSLGNLVTGPVKFFTLTTVIGVRQEVVDSST